MPLKESPFPNGFVWALHGLGWALVFPCFWFLDRLIAVCMSTSQERVQRRGEECYLWPLKVFFGSLLFLTLFLASLPFALLGFLFWAPLQFARRPFSYRQQEVTVTMQDRNAGWEEAGTVTFGFASANLCLLPDSLARFNNLGHTQRRAAAIGQSIVQGVSRPHIRIFVDSPSSGGHMTPSCSLFPHAGSGSYGSMDTQATGQTMKSPSDGELSRNCASETQPVVPGQTEEAVEDGEILQTSPGGEPGIRHSHPSSDQQPAVNHNPPRRTLPAPLEVSSLFPANVDMLCLQEVFDKRAASKLAGILAPLYGHVLYDVGVYACSARSFKFFNSGLFVASRYPVMDAQYRCFPNGRGEDSLAAKGLLSVKVQIGLKKGEKKMVGYLNCTHLHAPERDGPIRCEQLDMLTKWILEFQTATRQEDELVMFDVLCGDFNFDNSSPEDSMEQNHNVFNEYTDVCRAGPGQEKPWVIGTLLQQPTLYDESVRTPESLQQTLEDEEQRKTYLAPPIPREDTPFVYPEPGKPWVGRRIDYLLYRESTLTDQCHTEVEDFTYVTQLAGLTDHIPVGLRINVILDQHTAANPV